MKLAAEGHQCYVTASYRNICAGTVMDLILKSWICQQQRALYASLRVAVPSPPFCITGGGGGRVQLHVGYWNAFLHYWVMNNELAASILA